MWAGGGTLNASSNHGYVLIIPKEKVKILMMALEDQIRDYIAKNKCETEEQLLHHVYDIYDAGRSLIGDVHASIEQTICTFHRALAFQERFDPRRVDLPAMRLQKHHRKPADLVELLSPFLA